MIDCLTKYKALKDQSFQITVKKKRREQVINIVFPNSSFYHLVKFSEIKKYSNNNTIKKIKTSDIHCILPTLSSSDYQEIINCDAFLDNEKRIELVTNLKEILESEIKVYKYVPEKLKFYTRVKSDFVIKFFYDFDGDDDVQCYLFLQKSEGNKYVIKSIFADDRDFIGFEKPFGVISSNWVYKIDK